jgi:hypothetical protein
MLIFGAIFIEFLARHFDHKFFHFLIFGLRPHYMSNLLNYKEKYLQVNGIDGSKAALFHHPQDVCPMFRYRLFDQLQHSTPSLPQMNRPYHRSRYWWVG